jgi:radical SAM superfamily enzyme YgiQ (UPF0313 family)
MAQIALIEPKSDEESLWSLVKQPRLGPVILATILKEKGHNVKIFCESIAPIDWGFVGNCDICGVSYLSHTADEAYAISDKLQSKGIKVIHGGPHATLLPEDAIKHCDIIVRNEGDATLTELIECLEKKKDYSKIKGISFLKNGKLVNNPCPDNINLNCLPSPDLSLINGYCDKKLFDLYFRTGVVSTSRGCPFNCEFCSVIKLFGRQYRQRDPTKVIADIEAHNQIAPANSIFFVDDNFAANPESAKNILREIIAKKYKTRFNTQIRASAAKDEELVILMKKANLNFVYIGFESVDDDTLKQYNKHQSVKDEIEGIKMLKKHGIAIHGMFVFGSDADNPDIVSKTVKFCLDNHIDTVQFFALTPLPGTELTKRLTNENRIIKVPWKCIDLQHVCIFPKKIRPSILQKEIINGYKRYYSFSRAFRELIRGNWFAFYCAFFGRILVLNKAIAPYKNYITFLEIQEKNRYKNNEFIA